MKKYFVLILVLPLIGCTYYSNGAITIKASKVSDATGMVSGSDPKVIHSWERCFGAKCEEVLKQRKEAK